MSTCWLGAECGTWGIPSVISLIYISHSLNIEIGRYKNIIRPERKCTNCSKGDIEDEKHFIVNCPLYENIRVTFFDKVIDLCQNFRYMDTSSKFVWLFTNEHEQVLKKLGSFIEECFLLWGHNWSYRYH